MEDIKYLEWFTKELERQYEAYSIALGNEKEGRKSGIKNFFISQMKLIKL